MLTSLTAKEINQKLRRSPKKEEREEVKVSQYTMGPSVVMVNRPA
jgi:hypothetical protein